MCTAELPEAQQICGELILALLDEFRKIRETLPNLGKKHIKHKLGLCMQESSRVSVHVSTCARDILKSLIEGMHVTRCPAMELKGSQTERNLLAAFAGESQARTRYTFFASAAKKEGYEQISAIFQETADNEKEHAELFFKLLKGGMVKIIASYPAGVIGTTAENLREAAEGEKMEWGTLYPNFAEAAEEEGFKDAARTFRMVAKVEKYHERRYRKLLANVEQGEVFQKSASIQWKCRNCGYVHKGKNAPERCPVCDHTRSYFEVWCENY